MEHKTGTFAELWGLSPEGLKFYIKKGLLDPLSLENIGSILIRKPAYCTGCFISALMVFHWRKHENYASLTIFQESEKNYEIKRMSFRKK